MERLFIAAFSESDAPMALFVAKLLWRHTTMFETAQNNPEITRANPRITPINPRQKRSRANFQKRFWCTTDKPWLIQVASPHPSATNNVEGFSRRLCTVLKNLRCGKLP